MIPGRRSRQSPDTEGDIECQRTRRYGFDVHGRLFAHAHHRTLTELFIDLAESHFECLLTIWFACHVKSFQYTGIGPDVFSATPYEPLLTVKGIRIRAVALRPFMLSDHRPPRIEQQQRSFEQLFDQVFRWATRKHFFPHAHTPDCRMRLQPR